MKRYLFLITGIFFLSSCSAKKITISANRHSVGKQKVTKRDSLVNKYSPEGYIERFKEIAIKEMSQYGIPASITLAQGLLESGNGNSVLAREANNHFGIKCHSDWTGKTFLQDDDKKNDCFRVYDDPEESYKDHSEFLKKKRYAFLFELDKGDYTGWAYGLKQAGYATNPKYPELLIGLIERYNLNRFDSGETTIAKIKREDKALEVLVEQVHKEEKKEAGRTSLTMKVYEVKQGDTLYSISKRFGLTVDEVKILNSINGADIKLGQLLVVSK